MNRQAAKNARRAQAGQAAAREIDVPLPLRGIFSQAKSANISNLFAAELHNWQSNGLSLEFRPAARLIGRDPMDIIQRVPFEFGKNSCLVNLYAGRAMANNATFKRSFNGSAATSYISSNVILADGLAAPIRFDGIAFTVCEFTISDSNKNPANFDGVIAHHDRLYFWKRGGGLEFYYGDVGAVAGALSLFPLDRLGNITGSIVTMLSLTMDAGHGMNDVLAIITSTGQMILYEGLNPGDPNDWRLLSRVSAGVPVSNRAVTQIGSDAWILTKRGLVSVADSARSSELAFASQLSQPISAEILKLMSDTKTKWQLITAADGSMLVINAVKGGTASQFIYYLNSKSWATADYPAQAWYNFNGALGFTSTDGREGIISHTAADEVITARLVSSWFRTGGNASIAYVLPTIEASGPLSVRVVVLADHADEPGDIAMAEQIVTLVPNSEGSQSLSLNELIGCDAVGSTFQLTLEVTAAWANLTELKVAIGG